MSELYFSIFRWTLIVVNFTIFFCSGIGNSFVIFVLSREKSKSKTDHHILSLATADLLMSSLGIPMSVAIRTFGAPHDFYSCHVVHCCLLALYAISIFSLLAVTFDRYWAICHPLYYRQRSETRTKSIIACCWVVGIFIGYLPVMGWNSGEFEGICDPRVITDYNFFLYVISMSGFTSCSLVIVLYIRIYFAIRNQVRIRKEMFISSIDILNQKLEIKATKTLAFVVVTCLCLWLPATISVFIMTITNDHNYSTSITGITTTLVYLNSALDPIIYAYRMRNIQTRIKKILSCWGRGQATAIKASTLTLEL